MTISAYSSLGFQLKASEPLGGPGGWFMTWHAMEEVAGGNGAHRGVVAPYEVP